MSATPTLQLMLEPQAAGLLAEHGIEYVPHELATSADEASRIVVDLCRQAKAKRVTRVKSMLGEEIGQRGFEIGAGDGSVFRRRGGEGKSADIVRAVGFERFPKLGCEGFFHPLGAGHDFGFFR